MWLKEGLLWNKETGERQKADEELMYRVRGGGTVTEEQEYQHVVVSADAWCLHGTESAEKAAASVDLDNQLDIYFSVS